MASPGPRSAADYLVAVMRKVTRTAQLLPFAYLALYAVVLLTELFLPETLFCIVDDVACVSPLSVGVMLTASHILRLCVWHKTACVLPMLSRVTEYIDTCIITFTRNEVVLINTLVHEIHHLASVIADGLGVDLLGETPAYVAGDAAMALAHTLCDLGCSHCHSSSSSSS